MKYFKIIEEVFYWTMLAWLTIDVLMCIYNIKKKKISIEINEKSSLWKKSNEGGLYRAEDLVNDVMYLRKNLREKKKRIEILQLAVLFFIIIYVFKPLPLIFLFLFFSSIIINVGRIAVKLLKGGGVLKLMEGENLSPDSSWRELTWSLLKIPFYWSLATIYLALSIGTGKLGKDVIYLYAPSHIVNRPIWLIKVAFKLTYGIWNIKNRDEFKRKKKKLWFKIIIRCLKWEIFKVISSSYKTIHHLIVGNKITILNREVVLNPPRLKQYLSEIDIRKVDLKFWKTGIVVFNKQSHVIIMSENEEYGFIMTSSRGFKSEDGLEVLSNSVSLENIDQRFIFSKINKSELRIEEGALFKHFANNKWHNYENFAGLILRLNLTYKYGITDTICDQGKKSMYIKLNEENENTYEKIYSWYRNTEEKNIEENLAWKLQHERDENELEKNREIEAKLYEMSNKELYIKLKENGELLEPIKGLSRSMRGEDFNWKDIK